MIDATAGSKVMIGRMWRTLLALLVLVGMLLAFSSGPAVAAKTFTVNKTNDDPDRDLSDARCDTSTSSGDQCSLRAAIEEANDTSGADTIEFDISGSGVKTISPESSLPRITDAVTIDGYTQNGARENTLPGGNNAVLKVKLDGQDAGSFALGLRISASDTTIRGLVINRFGSNGIELSGSEESGNLIEGNLVGTDTTGTLDKGNGGAGVSILSGFGHAVGGTQPAQRNVISGNGFDGVFVAGNPDNEVEGNFIGTRADGTGDLGNDGNGVTVFSPENTVGGADPRAANVISGNGGNGVLVLLSDTTGVSILSNSIFSNDDLGVDLADDGVTNNDNDDPDTGENNLQNFPVIDSAAKNLATGFTTIKGTLNSNPNENFLIQCFLAGVEPDGSGHGEGKVLLDTTSRSTNPSGNVSFQCDTREAPPGRQVTATATNVDGEDTSEFSDNVEVTAPISPQ